MAAAGGSHLVKPPVVRGYVDVRAAERQQLARLLVKDHGVSAGDALHERAAERRRLGEQRRKAARSSLFVDQPRARAVERRDAAARLFQDIDGASQFVRLPDVILVAEGVVFAG